MNIKLLVMDVDGTLTDGRIYMGDTGEICKAFHVKDGYGIANLLKEQGIIPVIITGRESKIVETRCKELGIVYLFQGVENKIKMLNKLLEELHLSYNEVAYIGDDINDLCCMEQVKIAGCPRDAATQIREIAGFISQKNGGDGAVREFIDWLIAEIADKRK